MSCADRNALVKQKPLSHKDLPPAIWLIVTAVGVR